MFKPQHYDEMSELVSEFNWELLISNPNSDQVLDWVAEVNGLLWEFDGPSSEEFKKKIDSLKNMWGGVNAGTLPNYNLSQDVSDIKQFLKSKLVGMRREKEKINSKSNTSSQEKPLFKLGEAGLPGQPGSGGSIFIHAENFNMNGNGRISADGGGYVVQENEVNNLGTINIEISEVVNNLTKLTELVSESDLDEEDKRQLIGDIETVKAQSIKPNPDKTILKRSWQAVEVASSIAGAAQLIGMIGSFVLPHIR